MNATSDIVLTRRLRIVKLLSDAGTVTLGYEFRSTIHQAAVSIQFSPNALTLNGYCQDEYFVDVEFQIDASIAPSDHMPSGGAAGYLDFNEVGGWLLLTTSDDAQHVRLPFHMIIRKSANVTMETTTFDDSPLNMTQLPLNLSVQIQNVGAGTAQIGACQLLLVRLWSRQSAFGPSIRGLSNNCRERAGFYRPYRICD